MGLAVSLEDENRQPVDEQVGDPRNLLHRILPDHDDRSYCCLRFIDWYGDTVFNHLQMGEFLEELDRVAGQAREPGARELLAQVETLARRCQSEVHIYLRFIGD